MFENKSVQLRELSVENKNIRNNHRIACFIKSHNLIVFFIHHCKILFCMIGMSYNKNHQKKVSRSLYVTLLFFFQSR